MERGSATADRAFAYGEYAIVVRASSASILAWLEELLAPSFEARDAPASPDAPVVHVRVDAEELRERVRTARPTGQDVACFTMDGGEERLPRMRLPDGSEIAVDATNGVALGVRADGARRRIDVLAATERPAARLAALRVVRELAHAHAVGLGDVPVHGAAVAAGEGVTLFVGGKRAGKSSLLVHALAHDGVGYVANDRAFVRVGAGAPLVHGMPTIVALREDTLALSPRLREEVASGAWHYASTVAEARASRRAGTAAEGSGARWPPGLSPAQVCAIAGAARAARGPLARLVFPEVAAAAAPGQRFSLERLSAAEASARVLRDGLVAGGRSAAYLSGAAPGAPNALAAAVRALAAAVPSFRCALGRGAYAPPSVWEAIRAA